MTRGGCSRAYIPPMMDTRPMSEQSAGSERRMQELSEKLNFYVVEPLCQPSPTAFRFNWLHKVAGSLKTSR
ncbi:hypothetical protein EVAR_17526_1 [Eumeta japonica]|uniref:Uncharacterized protein n=1 Tax=Eumeta variegata TaxID=151549 RepID=A0A4C1WQ82_EUMVA|nr:hypothetical protein EVAR_17526_1 [Eumeta japonica]